MPKFLKKKIGGLKLAAANFEISEAKWGYIQLLPYGEFRASDGRPEDVPYWVVNEENGHDLVEIANSQENKLVVDYEHQTINSQINGQPAIAAGWMEWLKFTPQGIFAEVRWTDKAAEHIKAGEYRYISAVFAYDKNGMVRKIFHAALTNNPALDGMDEAMVAASNTLINPQLNQQFNQQLNQEDNMDILQLVIAALCMSADTTEEQAITALSAIKDKADKSKVALSEVYDKLEENKQQVVALSAKAFDPSKFVPVDQVAALQAELNTVKQSIEAEKREALITAALSSGQLTPALKPWAESLSIEALTGYIEKAQPAVALNSQQLQTGGVQAKNSGGVTALTADQKEAAKCLGMTEEEFIKQKEGK